RHQPLGVVPRVVGSFVQLSAGVAGVAAAAAGFATSSASGAALPAGSPVRARNRWGAVVAPARGVAVPCALVSATAVSPEPVRAAQDSTASRARRDNGTSEVV